MPKALRGLYFRPEWTRGAIIVIVVVAGLVAGTFGYVGDRVFAQAKTDALRPVDAIVVLGGAHDGREMYGVDLARAGVSDTVAISDPYGPRDTNPDLPKACASSDANVSVTCFRPEPATTRGEAQWVEDMAAKHGWRTVMVISWRYHLPRARYIFGHCAPDIHGVFVAVPREYRHSALRWTIEYTYQTAAFAKAAVVGC